MQKIKFNKKSMVISLILLIIINTPFILSKYSTTFYDSIVINVRNPKYTVNFYPNIIPSEYQEVEYIETTGTQYIDTNVSANSNIKFQVKLSTSNATAGTVIGVGGIDGERKSFRLFNYNNEFYLDYGSGYKYNRIFGGTWANNVIYELEVGNRYIKDITTGNDIISGSEVPAFEYEQTIKVFKDGTSTLNGKLYYLRLYDNNELVRNFVPCYRKSDNEIGVYDIVNNQFYANSGTGTFKMGPLKIQQVFIYGTSQNLAANTFVRDNYHFTGWNTSFDGTGTSYQDEQEVLNLSSVDGDEINLYAQWEKNPIVTFDPMGGTISEGDA